MKNTRLNCSSHISAVSCERWSFSETHPVSVVCLLSAHWQSYRHGYSLWVGGVWVWGFFCLFFKFALMCYADKFSVLSCWPKGQVKNGKYHWFSKDSSLTCWVLLLYLHQNTSKLYAAALEYAHPAEGTLLQLNDNQQMPHLDENACVELLNDLK